MPVYHRDCEVPCCEPPANYCGEGICPGACINEISLVIEDGPWEGEYPLPRDPVATAGWSGPVGGATIGVSSCSGTPPASFNVYVGGLFSPVCSFQLACASSRNVLIPLD